MTMFSHPVRGRVVGRGAQIQCIENVNVLSLPLSSTLDEVPEMNFTCTLST